MSKALSVYKTAVIRGQQAYTQQVNQGERVADGARHEHDSLLRMAEEGFRFPELREATVNYVYTIFGAVERWGEWSEWSSLLQNMVTQLADRPQLYLKVVYWLSHVHYLNRNFEDALTLLLNAQKVAINLSMPKFIAQIQQRLCNVYLATGKLEKAKEAVGNALAMSPSLPDESALAATLWNCAGLIALQQGDHNKAIESFDTAVSLWQQQQALTSLSRCENNLGVAYFQLGQFEKATVHFEQVLTYLDALNRPVDKLKAANNLASVYYMQEAYSEGEKILLRAIAESRQWAGIYHVRGSLNHNLGNTLLAQKRYGEAEVYLNNSLYLWDLANDALEKANTHDTLGELFQAQHAYAQATEHYQAACQLAQQYPNHPLAKNLITQYEAEIEKCEAALQQKPNTAS